MLKKIIKGISILLSISAILGTLVLINLFLENLKGESYKEQININSKVFNNIRNDLLDNMEIQYNTIISNNLINEVKNGEYVSGDNQISIKYIKKELQHNKNGFFTKKDDVYFLKLMKLPNDNGYIELSSNISDIINKVNSKYGKKIIFVFNEAFLNDLDFNEKVKNYSVFLNNTIIKNNDLVNEELKTIKENFIGRDLLTLNKEGFILKDKLFITQNNLVDLNNDKIGSLYIIENKEEQGSTNYIIEKLESLSQVIMMSVLALLLAGSLLLY